MTAGALLQRVPSEGERVTPQSASAFELLKNWYPRVLLN
jgi:hypothetical protein